MDHSEINRVFPDLDKQLFKTITTRIDSFKESLKKSGLKIDLAPEVKSDLIKIFLFSEFITAILIKNPGILKTLIQSKDLFKSYSNHTYTARLERKIAKDMDVERVKELLLQVKVYETIRIAWRDLTGKALLEETLCDLSNLADVIVDTATKVIYDELCKTYGVPCDHEGNFQGMIVLGMGKLGAGELNFSSDIDLIFVYPVAGYTNGENIISNEEFFTKACRLVLSFFSPGAQAVNFYRIDTRLRPYGDGGPLVMSSSVFEEYYQAQGREWERYAMIKAR
ncbi:MAG: bifunctional [glutamate--ammonia ligase]-adenylyl-L-tyrosine phosphorylase/[glutamate--ammonia-ligase] adenylyltransferase, partial [Deltaproteobacteria bacterium]|nr:bifunctional [glutamate--ammonia ligase]-adenylyl-L-tyrosine phosphorylase/[glutamate--ammonia-ligase] adenylyltransferase [Candidatus Desulfobacula maris]